LRSGSADDIDAVLREHGQAVWRLVVRLVGNDGPDAADCFQQAFVEFASLHRGGGIRQSGALLKRIAAARSIDAVRRRMRERRRAGELDVGLISTGREFEPDAQAEASEFLELLREALAELPEPQSAAFVLTQIEELSGGEAAAAIDVTVNHLGVLLHRARTALQARFEAYKPTREFKP